MNQDQIAQRPVKNKLVDLVTVTFDLWI